MVVCIMYLSLLPLVLLSLSLEMGSPLGSGGICWLASCRSLYTRIVPTLSAHRDGCGWPAGHCGTPHTLWLQQSNLNCKAKGFFSYTIMRTVSPTATIQRHIIRPCITGPYTITHIDRRFRTAIVCVSMRCKDC